MPVALNDLRKLATVLPPSERVFAAEIPDIVSSLVAVVQHGEGLLRAGEQGAQEVADFFHDRIAAKAKDDGVDAPLKGAPVVSVPLAQGSAPASSDVAALSAQVAALTDLVRQLAQKDGAVTPSEPAPSSSDASGVTAPSPAPEADPTASSASEPGTDPTAPSETGVLP